MSQNRTAAIALGAVVLFTLLSLGLFQYANSTAEPSQIDSFELTGASPTCEVQSKSDLIVEVPFRALHSYDSVRRITLVEVHGFAVAGARLKEPAGEPLSMEHAVDGEGWVEIGSISEPGETLVLHLRRTSSATDAAFTAIRLGVYPGETRWRDDLPVSITFDGSECSIVVTGDSATIE
jgi:hypothetical protein